MGRPERPVDPTAGPLQRFAWDLRQLRQRAGGVSYRQLARRANYSATALSAAAAGEQLPSRAVTLAYVEACGGNRKEWATRWTAVAEELAADPEGEMRNRDVRPAPYRGLAAFQPEDAKLFFGREQLIDELVGRLADTPFLTLVGASGTGKSSLLRAGLVAAARAGRLSGEWSAVLLTPGAHPLEELAVQVAALHRISPGSLHADLVADASALDLAIRQATAGDLRARVLLVVDQFEEVFTLCGDERERVAYVNALLRAAHGTSSRATVVLGVRADFYGHCTELPGLLPVLREAQVLVGPMDPDELRAAILGPAAAAGLTVEPELVGAVIADVAGRPGALPLMSHALLETWRRREGRTLTLAGYHDAGGVGGAIGRTAEYTYGELDEGRRRIARNMFLRLTALGDGEEDTGRRVDRAELATPGSAEVAGDVLDRLARARLVTLDADRVEVAHEALIREWPRLRAWLAEDRDRVRVHRRLTEAAAEWADNGRDPSCLYGGARLAAWLDRPGEDLDNLNEIERAFLAASRWRRDRETTARRRRTGALISGLSIALAVISLLAVTAVAQRDRARDQRDTALSRQLAVTATAQLGIDPELGLLLARRAYAEAPTREAETALRQAVVDSRVRATFRGHRGAVTAVTFSPDGAHVASAGADGTVRIWTPGEARPATVLRGHTGRVTAVTYRRDGRAIVSGGTDGTVRVWDTRTHRSVALRGHRGAVNAVAFSPDGAHVVSAGVDGTVYVWTPGTTTPPTVRHDHTGAVLAVAYSADGQEIASAGADGTIQIAVPGLARSPEVLVGHAGPVTGVAFHPDGRHLASGGEDETVRIWDRATGEESAILRDHDGPVHSVAYSPDGQYLSSAGADQTVRIRESTGKGEPEVLRGHEDAVLGAAFSPDGRRLVTGGADRTVRVWQWARTELTLRGDEGGFGGVGVSPRGAWVAGGDNTGVVRIWRLPTGTAPLVLTGHTGPVNDLAVSHDGHRLATAGADGTVRLWRPDSGAATVLRGHRDPVFGVAFSPDGQRVAGAGKDGTVWIWTTGRGTPLVLTEHGGSVLGVAFSPDGRWLVSVCEDGAVRVHDLRHPATARILGWHDGPVLGVAVSPDGRRVFTTGNDGTVRIWDVRGRAEPVVLRGHEGPVYRVDPSPDGRWLASAGNDGTVRLWNLQDGTDPIVLRGHQNEVNSVHFSPGGRLVTASDDGTVRVWRCEACRPVEEVLALARERGTRELSQQERHMFLPPT
jgi:WD40 repeat protein